MARHEERRSAQQTHTTTSASFFSLTTAQGLIRSDRKILKWERLEAAEGRIAIRQRGSGLSDLPVATSQSQVLCTSLMIYFVGCYYIRVYMYYARTLQ
jgi:hypothetical protein